MYVYYRLPLQIGVKVSVERFNTFVIRCEALGYKFERRPNGDVFIVDMAHPEHESVVYLVQRFFDIANGGVFLNPPISILGQPRKRIPCNLFDPLMTYNNTSP